MAEYTVHTGLNAGPDDTRFEPGDKIGAKELAKLVPSKRTRDYLISEGHISLDAANDTPDSEGDES